MLDQDHQQASPSNGMGGSQPQLCDKILVDYALDAIKIIKKLHQKCDIKSIFSYLREQKPKDEKILHLTEKELVRQLNLAVSDGILLRKSVSEWQQKQLSISSPIKSTNTTPHILPESLNNSDKETKKEFLILLVETISKLNNQYINTKQMNQATIETTTAEQTKSCHISSICKYLIETNKFKILDNSSNSIKETRSSSDATISTTTFPDDSNSSRINSRLKECIKFDFYYLLRDKINDHVNIYNLFI